MTKNWTCPLVDTYEEEFLEQKKYDPRQRHCKLKGMKMKRRNMKESWMNIGYIKQYVSWVNSYVELK